MLESCYCGELIHLSGESVLLDLKDLKSKDIDLKWAAINNLRKYLQSNPLTDFRSRMILKSLLGLSKDPDDGIRETVLITLMEVIQDSTKIDPLVIRSLADSNSGIRSIALEWFNKQNHPNLRNFIVKALQDEGEVVRKTALDIVVEKKIEGIENYLLKLLSVETGGLRRTVIYALGKLKTAQAINALIEIMRNPEYDDWTRNQASSALNHMGGREIIIPFVENLADPNNYVRETASAFLKKNENDLIPAVISSGRLDFLGLLQYATETTRQNFDSLINTLKTQMKPVIDTYRSKLMNEDQIVLKELIRELNSTKIATKILIEKILNFDLIQISDDIYLTETGLKNSLIQRFNEKSSIYLPTLKKEEPFNRVNVESIIELINSISSVQELKNDFYLTKEIHSNILESFNNTGLLNLYDIAEKLNQPIRIIKELLIPAINSSEEGWFNSRNEYMTLVHIKKQISKQIDDYGVISIKKLLEKTDNPNIEHQIMIELINSSYKGKWLEEFEVFLNEEKIHEIEQNTSGLEESDMKDLLTAIDLDFGTFLNSLQKIITIKTFKTKNGQFISLESLHSELRKIILSKRYINIISFMKSMKLDSLIETKKSIIMDYITQEFSGRTDPKEEIFVTEDLISEIMTEIEPKLRINFSVLGFKLNIDPDVLSIIVTQIIFIRGFSNIIGEFVTQNGIIQEIAGIMEFRQEFSFQELFEILEISNDKKNMSIVRELIAEDKNLIISQDSNMIISQKMSIKKIISYIKNPEIQLKEEIPAEEISMDTNIPLTNVIKVLESLTQNNLIAGTLDAGKYRP